MAAWGVAMVLAAPYLPRASGLAKEGGYALVSARQTQGEQTERLLASQGRCGYDRLASTTSWRTRNF